MARRNSKTAEVQVEPKYVSLSGGATYTGFSERTLREHVYAGKLKAYRLSPNGDIRLLLTDLDALFVA